MSTATSSAPSTNGARAGELETGLVVRAYSNQCDVALGEAVLPCRFRGRLKLEERRILTGDRVRVRPLGDGTGMVEAVEPRRTELVRPPVANVDQAVVVFSLERPPVDRATVERLAILAQAEGLEVVFCCNKADLAGAERARETVALYAGLGYRTCVTSAPDKLGLEDLRQAVSGRVSVLAGPSGVGKSSLLNALEPGLRLATADVSARGGRGRHTTRGVQLLRVAGGWLADSPGFTALSLAGIGPQALPQYFPEIAELAGGCRFRGCRHRAEPGCAVKAAVAEGRVDAGRYARYLEFLAEAEAAARPY